VDEGECRSIKEGHELAGQRLLLFMETFATVAESGRAANRRMKNAYDLKTEQATPSAVLTDSAIAKLQAPRQTNNYQFGFRAPTKNARHLSIVCLFRDKGESEISAHSLIVLYTAAVAAAHCFLAYPVRSRVQLAALMSTHA